MANKAILPATKIPDIQNTLAEVFIIESLSKSDEKAKRFEGQLLSDMLRLSGKNPKYYYFQSKDEIPHVIGLFRASKFRYLHISCHASNTEIATTNESLSYADFAEYFAKHLILRRLFISACKAGNNNFVQAMSAKNTGMHSIAAPAESISFDHAAALWSAFYISVFTEKSSGMKHSTVENKLSSLCNLFGIKFYFASYLSEKKSWTDKTLE